MYNWHNKNKPQLIRKMSNKLKVKHMRNRKLMYYKSYREEVMKSRRESFKKEKTNSKNKRKQTLKENKLNKKEKKQDKK